MCGARSMAPLFEQCASASGATARTSSSAATKQSCWCSVKPRSGASESAKFVNTPAISTSAEYLASVRRNAVSPSGLTPRRPMPGIHLDMHARTAADACRRACGGLDTLVVVDRGLDALVDQRFVTTRVAPADNQHRQPEPRDVERLSRRSDAEPARAALDGGLGRELEPVPVAVRLDHRHHAHATADVPDQRRRVGADRRHVDLDPLARREGSSS